MAFQENSYIELKLRGSPDDEGKLRIDEFVEVLERVRVCLQKLDKHISSTRKITMFYRIKQLSSGSASVVIEAVPYKPRKNKSLIRTPVLDRFAESIDSIQQQCKLPNWFKDKELLEDFKGLTSQFKKHVSSIEIRSNGKTFVITKQLETNIHKILGELIYTSKGTVAGYLDAINVHGIYYFFVYPSIGSTRIRCNFKEGLLTKIRQGIKRYVNVFGVLHYRQGEAFPTEIDAEDIEIYPKEDELPTLGSLRGMAPGMTGDLDSVAFVRKLREAYED